MFDDYVELQQLCPVCLKHLMLVLRFSERKQKSFVQVECSMNPNHLRAFCNSWPRTWKVNDLLQNAFANWKFDQEDIRCPICSADLDGFMTYTKKKGKPCLVLNCADRGSHFQAFMNKPSEIGWASFKSEVVEAEEENGNHPE